MEQTNAQLTAQEISTMRLLDNVPLLAGIGIEEQHMVARCCRVEHFPEKEIVIEKNEESDSLYIIAKGSVAILTQNPSKEWVKVNTLGKGDYFGEIALLRKVRRTARVSTLTPCTFLTINAEDFLKIYHFFPPRARDNVQIVIAKRLEQLRGYERSS